MGCARKARRAGFCDPCGAANKPAKEQVVVPKVPLKAKMIGNNSCGAVRSGLAPCPPPPPSTPATDEQAASATVILGTLAARSNPAASGRRNPAVLNSDGPSVTMQLPASNVAGAKICSQSGCLSKAVGRGLCTKHGGRGNCRVDGCETSAIMRGALLAFAACAL